MQALVVFESMYGNTREVAEAVAAGLGERLGPDGAVGLASVAQAGPQQLWGVDLLVVGGPTHAWSMSRASTRRSAAEAAGKPGSDLAMEPGAGGDGVREWLERLPRPQSRAFAAAFDTRMHAPLGLSGSAARKIAARLAGLGYVRVTAPEGFFVSKANHLEDGELARARAWGELLASAALPRPAAR